VTTFGDIAANSAVPLTSAEVLAALNGASGSIDADLLSLAPVGGGGVAALAGYTVSNRVPDKTYDANATTLDELADIVGTIISDLSLGGGLPVHIHASIEPRPDNAFSEATLPGSYPIGVTFMKVHGTGWGPGANDVGGVLTENSSFESRQRLTIWETGEEWRRVGYANAWGAWTAVGSAGSTPADASTSVKGISKLSVAPSSATDPIAVGDNDSRMSNQRVPTDSSVTNAKVDAAAAIAESKLNLASDAAAGTASRRTLGTGATQAAPGNDSRLSDARTPTTREWQAVFFYGGTLATQVGVGKFKLPNSGTPTITEVTIEVDTLPTGANVIADVNSVSASTNAKTSLYTTQGNRPQIAPGANYSNVATLPNTLSPGVGVSLSCDIDQVGSSVPGSNLVVIVRGTY
jgi:hypothetical protein